MSMRKSGLSFHRSVWLTASGRASALWARALGLVLAFAGTTALATVGVLWIGVEQQLGAARETLQEERARLEAISRAAAVKPPPVRHSVQQVSHLNGVIRQLNTPWSDLLDAFERQTPPGVALILVEPDAGKRVVRVQAEARDVDALLAYVDLLASDAAFSGATPMQHETNEQDPNRPVRLSFELALKPLSDIGRRQP